MEILGLLLVLLCIALGLAVYFLPTIIASQRNHAQQNSILLLNLFLGWTFLGWLVALIWSVSSSTAGSSSVPVQNPPASLCSHCGRYSPGQGGFCPHCGKPMKG